MKTMLDNQYERCKEALVRLENLIPKDAHGGTTVPIMACELDDLDVFVQNAKLEIDTRRSAVDEAAKQILGADVMVKPEELRGVLTVYSVLGNAMAALDAGLACRVELLDAQRRLERVLASINQRDASWH